MSTRPPKSTDRSFRLDEPYAPGDSIPAPVATEGNSESAWALWSDAVARQNAIFADTAPASIPAPLPQGDPRYANTVPASLKAEPKAAKAAKAVKAAALAKSATLAEAMLEVRRENRVCPKPDSWTQLYDLLADKHQGQQGWQPPPPLIGAAWSRTPSLAKRMCLRDHVEWAEAHGQLDKVLAFLRGLPEDQWHHMGD